MNAILRQVLQGYNGLADDDLLCDLCGNPFAEVPIRVHGEPEMVIHWGCLWQYQNRNPDKIEIRVTADV